MNKKFVEEMKVALEQIKKDLQTSLEDVAKKNSQSNTYEAKFPEYGTSEEESADEVSTFIDRLSLGENMGQNLNDVEAALERIKRGTYGLCENCHKEIDQARLKAMPTARWCLSCKNKLNK
jgi:RNA polymerase-binding protein DksA